MTERSQSATYNAIDLIKFLMALCVVAIHTSVIKEPAILEYSTALDIFTRMAVPFFFMSSSFFLFRKTKDIPLREKRDRINRYIRRMIRLYVIWSAIYFPIAVYRYISDGVPLVAAVGSILQGFFLYGENHMSWQLWYLLCTIYSMVAINLLIGWKWKDFHILALSMLVFCGSVVIRFLTETVDQYSGIFRYAVILLDLFFANGRIFTGMLYLTVGMCVANCPKLRAIPWYLSLAVAASAFLITVCWDNEITKQILYISFFLFALSIPLPDKNHYVALRRASTIVYFVHMIFVFILSLIPGMDTRYALKFVVVAVASLGVSWAVIHLEKLGNKKLICLFE